MRSSIATTSSCCPPEPVPGAVEAQYHETRDIGGDSAHPGDRGREQGLVRPDGIDRPSDQPGHLGGEQRRQRDPPQRRHQGAEHGLTDPTTEDDHRTDSGQEVGEGVREPEAEHSERTDDGDGEHD